MMRFKRLFCILTILTVLTAAGCSERKTENTPAFESVDEVTPLPTRTLEVNTGSVTDETLFGLEWGSAENDVIAVLGKPTSAQNGNLVYSDNAVVFGIPVVVEVKFGAKGYEACTVSYIDENIEKNCIEYYDLFNDELTTRFGKPSEDIIWAPGTDAALKKWRKNWNKPMADGQLILSSEWQHDQTYDVLTCFNENGQIYLSLDVSAYSIETPTITGTKIDENKIMELKWGYPRWRIRNILGWPDSTHDRKMIYENEASIAGVPMKLTVNSDSLSGLNRYELYVSEEDTKKCIADYDSVRTALIAVFSDGKEYTKWADDVPQIMRNDRGMWSEAVVNGKLTVQNVWKTETSQVSLTMTKSGENVVIKLIGKPINAQ